MHVIRELRVQRTGNGGDARSCQISWLLANAGMYETRLGECYERCTFTNLSAAIRFICTERVALAARSSSIKRVGYRYREHKNHLKDISKPAVSIWEYTASPVGPKVAGRHGLPVVALPHNIESLVSEEKLLYTRSKQFLTRLRKELHLLKACQRIYVISRHDQWFYQQFGVASEYLPYFPAGERYQSLCRIRERRQGRCSGDFVLVLGSAQYAPIRRGMECLLSMLVSHGIPEHVPIHVAGFDTENLRERFQHERLHIEGTVTSARLQELQEQARLLLVHSREGSGALTRIPDALVAGIPVVANPLAARSTDHLSGVYVYESRDELVRLLLAELGMPPMPERPAVHEARFIDDLRSLAMVSMQKANIGNRHNLSAG